MKATGGQVSGRRIGIEIPTAYAHETEKRFRGDVDGRFQDRATWGELRGTRSVCWHLQPRSITPSDPLPPTKHTPLISPTRPPEKFRRGAMATRPVSAEPTARRVLGLVIKRGIYSLALVNSQVDHPASSPSPAALACWIHGQARHRRGSSTAAGAGTSKADDN